MARNPYLPQTAGETAVDKFLNQILPRMIDKREQKNEREEVRAEDKRRYEIQQQQYKDRIREGREDYIEKQISDMRIRIASGDVKGLDAEIDRVARYQAKHGLSMFNPVTFKDDLLDSSKDYDDLSELQNQFYQAKDTAGVVDALGKLDTLADNSDYINNEDILFAYKHISDNRDKATYRGFFEGNTDFDIDKIKDKRILYGAYTDAIGQEKLVKPQEIVDEIAAMNARWAEARGELVGGSLQPQYNIANPKHKAQAIDNILKSSGKMDTVNANQSSFRLQFLGYHNDNVARYMDKNQDGELDLNPIEQLSIENQGKHWALVDLYGIRFANDVMQGRQFLTADQQVKVADVMVKKLTFPKQYLTGAQELQNKEVDEIKAEYEELGEKINNNTSTTLERNRYKELGNRIKKLEVDKGGGGKPKVEVDKTKLYLQQNQNLNESIEQGAGEGSEEETEKIEIEKELQAQENVITEDDVKASGNISESHPLGYDEPLKSGDKVITNIEDMQADIDEYESQASEIFDLARSGWDKRKMGIPPTKREMYVLNNLDKFPRGRGWKDDVDMKSTVEELLDDTWNRWNNYKESVVDLAQDESTMEAFSYQGPDRPDGSLQDVAATTLEPTGLIYKRFGRDDFGNAITKESTAEEDWAYSPGRWELGAGKRQKMHYNEMAGVQNSIQILTEMVRAEDGTYSLPREKYKEGWKPGEYLFAILGGKTTVDVDKARERTAADLTMSYVPGEGYKSRLKASYSEKEYKEEMKALRKEEARLKRLLPKDRDIHFKQFEKLFDGTIN